MRNWFHNYKVADVFYGLISQDNPLMKLAMSPSAEYKMIDLKRWGQLHQILSDILGIKSSDSDYFDTFLELADVFRELTDRLGHLPNKNEFLVAWRSWQMYKDLKDANESDTSNYSYEGIEVGKYDQDPLLDS